MADVEDNSGEYVVLYPLLMDGGRYYYRCADGGYQARSSSMLPICLWHGEDCIDWYLCIPGENGAAVAAAVEAHKNDSSIPQKGGQ